MVGWCVGGCVGGGGGGEIWTLRGWRFKLGQHYFKKKSVLESFQKSLAAPWFLEWIKKSPLSQHVFWNCFKNRPVAPTSFGLISKITPPPTCFWKCVKNIPAAPAILELFQNIYHPSTCFLELFLSAARRPDDFWNCFKNHPSAHIFFGIVSKATIRKWIKGPLPRLGPVVSWCCELFRATFS